MKEIDPQQTKRAVAFGLWLKAPMPMVTIFKTLNVKRLVKLAHKSGYKFNMLMCWCIGKAASDIEEFHLLPVNRKLIQFDKLGINIVVKTKDGKINTCDIPFSDDIELFCSNYLRLTKLVYETGNAHNLGDDYMIIGTSALVKYDIDGIVNLYSGIFNNPFMAWGKYKRRWMKTTLSISFQFHHTQMDGEQACIFLEKLQNIINKYNIL